MTEGGHHSSASRTGPASAAGGYANTGIHTGDVVLGGDLVPVRTAYREQVEQVFPWQLIGREQELAELGAFCTGGSGSYEWWQAPAWSGKSALMATFALSPPPGVRVVSFFITGRWAGQSDWTAFLDAAIGQLSEISGEPVPRGLTASAQRGWFARLLKDSAELCASRQERLILLVDGLDEDRGVTARADSHSIAALLPEVPPVNVKVVVAGRPDPPVPVDVPRRHPLRDPGIVRVLGVSPYASTIRDDLERELLGLLDDDGLAHDLLGFVAASGGGLSDRDLAELTGSSLWQTSRALRATTGRTFSRRNEGSTSPVYVLAHEELQRTAVECLGHKSIMAFRARLQVWADSYRCQGWPDITPGYLLRGYHQLLHSLNDTDGMTSLTTDPARQDRLLAVSGADAAILQELESIQEIVCSHSKPDLLVMLRLAAARERLVDRNWFVPADLPAVWATLGETGRAEAVTLAISDVSVRVRAVAALTPVLVERGADAVANRLRRHAESLVNAQDNPRSVALSRPSLIQIVAGLGETGEARALAIRTETDTDEIDQPWRAHALGRLAQATRALGDTAETRRIANKAEIAAIEAEPFNRASNLLELASLWTTLGEGEHARVLLAQLAELTDGKVAKFAFEARLRLAQNIVEVREVVPDPDSPDLAEMLLAIVRALTDSGEIDHAEAVANTINGMREQPEAWATLAKTCVRYGDEARGRQFALRAESRKPPRTGTDGQAELAAAGASALAGDGRYRGGTIRTPR